MRPPLILAVQMEIMYHYSRENETIADLRSRHTAITNSLLAAAATTDRADKNGMTALFYATEACNVSLVARLLEAGANPNVASNVGRLTPLAAISLRRTDTKNHCHLPYRPCEEGPPVKLYQEKLSQISSRLLEAGATLNLTLSNHLSLVESVRLYETGVIKKGPLRWNNDISAYQIESIHANGEIYESLQPLEYTTTGVEKLRIAQEAATRRSYDLSTKLRSMQAFQHQKEFDFFISYAHNTEGARDKGGNGLARALADALGNSESPMGRKFKVWIDEDCLPQGVKWQDGFMKGIEDSAVVIPLVSEGLLQRFLIPDRPQGDSVLTEWNLCLERSQRVINDHVLRVLPITVKPFTWGTGCAVLDAKRQHPQWDYIGRTGDELKFEAEDSRVVTRKVASFQQQYPNIQTTDHNGIRHYFTVRQM